MIKKAPILDRRNSVDQNRRNVFEGELGPGATFHQRIIRQRFGREGE